MLWLRIGQTRDFEFIEQHLLTVMAIKIIDNNTLRMSDVTENKSIYVLLWGNVFD